MKFDRFVSTLTNILTTLFVAMICLGGLILFGSGIAASGKQTLPNVQMYVIDLAIRLIFGAILAGVGGFFLFKRIVMYNKMHLRRLESGRAFRAYVHSECTCDPDGPPIVISE